MKFLNDRFSNTNHEPEPILQFKGLNGHINLFENHLVVDRLPFHKFLRSKLSGKYTLPLSQISEIHFRRASSLKKGYVRFISIGKDASYLSFLAIDKDDGTVVITKNNNDFVVRFIMRIHELNQSIDVLDLDDPAVSSQNNDVVDKIVDATNYGLAYAGEKIKEVDGKKAVKGAAYLGACAGEEIVKRKFNLRYKGSIAGNILNDSIIKSTKKSLNSDVDDIDDSEKKRS